MTTYQGHCHCGGIRFEVDIDEIIPFFCNCSFCVRRGARLQRVQADAFRLLSDAEAPGVYGNRDFSDHYFCRTCGIHCFTRLHRDPPQTVVSLACLDDVDTMAMTPQVFDGARLL
jgi:hypothetical protein